jgi:pimeloyl-ACP methyl ester carboxylesterase
MLPTIILEHGAYADASSWNAVIPRLLDAGHRVFAHANPLRALAGDAAALSDLVRTIEGPVLLVGHSYGGAVVTNVARDAGEIVGLVYVAAFALEPGESCADAMTLAPGGTLTHTLERVPRADGTLDTRIAHAKYRGQFAADLSEGQAALLAVGQRPLAEAALGEPSGDDPLWRWLPSWFVFGELDRSIPAGALRIMAERAGSRRTLEIAGASHAVAISHPAETTELILEAARESLGARMTPLKLGERD